MDMIRRFAAASVTALGDLECDITLATSGLALDGDVWDMAGADLTHFKAHPILLFNHDPELPVARASNISKGAGKITARATFPPDGISTKADEVRGLVKSGILTGISAGMVPLESEPLDRAKPRSGQRITKWRLLEASFVSVPCDAASTVTARAAKPGARGATAAQHGFMSSIGPMARAMARGNWDLLERLAHVELARKRGEETEDWLRRQEEKRRLARPSWQ